MRLKAPPYLGQKHPIKAGNMAKNSPLVGHFPVCTSEDGLGQACGARGNHRRVGCQKPAFTLKMSRPPAMDRSWIKLALRMLWKRAREMCVASNGLSGRNRAGATSLSQRTLRQEVA